GRPTEPRLLLDHGGEDRGQVAALVHAGRRLGAAEEPGGGAREARVPEVAAPGQIRLKDAEPPASAAIRSSSRTSSPRRVSSSASPACSPAARGAGASPRPGRPGGFPAVWRGSSRGWAGASPPG